MATPGNRSPEDSHPVGAAPGWAPAVRAFVLAGTDLCALLISGTLAFVLWAHPVRGQSATLYLPAAPFLVLIVLGYAQARLYPGFGFAPPEIIRRYWLITVASFLGLASLVFALKLDDVYSRVTLVLALILSLGLVPGLRWLGLRVFRRFRWWPEPVVLITDTARSARTQRLLANWPTGDLRPIGVVRVDSAGAFTDPDDPLATVGYAAGLANAEAGVQVAILDLERGDSASLIDRIRLLFPRVIILREYTELPVEGVQVHNLGGSLGLEYANNLARRQSRWVKRTMDLTVGAAALFLASPLLLAGVLAVKVASPGPVFFVQKREGRNGRLIRVPKLRTMRVDAERSIEEHLAKRPELREEWETKFKLRDDPRLIPGVGRWLRRFSIDELPQLISVVRGDMSLVGPRPLPHYHLEALSEQSRHLRQQVRPGLTGLWQVMSRGSADVEQQEAHDTYYIRNWSLWLDLYILARTGYPVLTGRGAH